ncbi:hypothetical protein GOBAR_DD34983 [Gossypium barbadense]|nr:hypothetical protein GOBAR_DD34983 [Gossypium barbadense]
MKLLVSFVDIGESLNRFGHSREEKQIDDERRKHKGTTTVVENDNKGAAIEKMRMGRVEIQPQWRKKRRTEGTEGKGSRFERE